MLVWADVETTGLDPEKDLLLEVALVVTDDALEEQAHLQLLVRPDASIRQTMSLLDPVVSKMHSDNHLLREVFGGDFTEGGWSPAQAHRMVHGFLNLHAKSNPPLAGSTVSFDRAFLQKAFPEAMKALSYRNVDVSSVKELCKRWRPDVYRAWADSQAGKAKAHRALADVRQSIAELRHYRQHWLVPSASGVVS